MSANKRKSPRIASKGAPTPTPQQAQPANSAKLNNMAVPSNNGVSDQHNLRNATMP